MNQEAEGTPVLPARPASIRRRDVAGVVLCGGASRRMGRDKALLRELDDRGADGARTRLEAAIECLQPWVETGWVACGSDPRYTELVARRPGWELVLDEVADAGPLAGLAAGLQAASPAWTLVLAVDMPGVGPAEIEALLGAAQAEDDIVCFDDERGPQPLLALYHRRCREPVTAALAAGERRMISFWTRPAASGRSLRVRSIALPRTRPRLRDGTEGEPSPAQDPLRNVNTPADWAVERSLRTVEE